MQTIVQWWTWQCQANRLMVGFDFKNIFKPKQSMVLYLGIYCILFNLFPNNFSYISVLCK